ncbi:MAG: LysM peptidoglycan-binding domain-containing protein [Candidatus Aureabacteria bacterium]|nr:LysM peptidoglycan-binding domain-containing protein [Candidatus Auribacterota bacterium]
MKKNIQVIVLSGLFLMIATGVVTLVHSHANGSINLAWTTRVTRYIQHTVNKGDTIEKLAMIYGTTASRILAKNTIVSDQDLVEGQKLIIPVQGYKEKLIL